MKNKNPAHSDVRLWLIIRSNSHVQTLSWTPPSAQRTPNAPLWINSDFTLIKRNREIRTVNAVPALHTVFLLTHECNLLQSIQIHKVNHWLFKTPIEVFNLRKAKLLHEVAQATAQLRNDPHTTLLSQGTDLNEPSSKSDEVSCTEVVSDTSISAYLQVRNVIARS